MAVNYEQQQRTLKGKYNVFVRNWWKLNPSWPDGLEPDGGARKMYLKGCQGLTLEEARQACKAWNDTHNPGKLSRKAEFESV